MPQGSTVKRLNAKRKRPAGGAGGELDRSTLNKSPFKNNLTHQTKKSHHWPHWEHTSWWWSRCCWWWWPALLWPGPLWTPTPSSLWTSCCRNYKSNTQTTLDEKMYFGSFWNFCNNVHQNEEANCNKKLVDKSQFSVAHCTWNWYQGFLFSPWVRKQYI